MSHIRMLVAEMPVLHADIIRRIVGEQPDMSIVGEVGAGGLVSEAVELTDPDVLLVATTSPRLPCTCLELVWARPWLRIIVLDITGTQDSFVETRLRERPREAWPESLVDAIRHPPPPYRDSSTPTGNGSDPP